MSEASSLFESVGGREGVRRIVESFYRRVEADDHMRPIYPEDLEPGKQKVGRLLFLWFLQQKRWLGGAPGYTERYGHPRLRRRHFPFLIDELAAGRWLRHMREAMHEDAVPTEVQAVIFARLGPLAHHMVNAGQDVPREPLSSTFLT